MAVGSLTDYKPLGGAEAWLTSRGKLAFVGCGTLAVLMGMMMWGRRSSDVAMRPVVLSAVFLPEAHEKKQISQEVNATLLFGIAGPKPEHVLRAPLQLGALASGVDVDTDVNARAVEQGQLGDCYFDATVAAIAHQKPEMIRSMFRSVTVNADKGTFVTQWFMAGRWELVTVNEQIPTDPKSGIPYFMWTSSETTLWPAVLEKAWAKIFGSYKGIEAGNANEVFQAILGVPVESLLVDRVQDDVLWSHVLGGIQKKYPMAGGTAGKGGYHGLARSHEYTIYGASANYRGYGRAVRLRNPWGINNYAGAIRGQSTVNGDFWLTWEEFKMNFGLVDIALTWPGYGIPGYFPVPLASGQGHGVAQFDSSTSEPFYAEIVWPSARVLREAGCGGRGVGSATLLVGRDRASVVSGVFELSGNVVRAKLPGGVGRWYVYVSVESTLQLSDISLNFYTTKGIKLGLFYNGVNPTIFAHLVGPCGRTSFTTRQFGTFSISATLVFGNPIYQSDGRGYAKVLYWNPRENRWWFVDTLEHAQRSMRYPNLRVEDQAVCDARRLKSSNKEDGFSAVAEEPLEALTEENPALVETVSPAEHPLEALVHEEIALVNATGLAEDALEFMPASVDLQGLSCANYWRRLTTELGGTVVPSDPVFPAALSSIARSGVDCGDSAHNLRRPCSVFNHWGSMIAVANRVVNDRNCLRLLRHGDQCGVWNKCARSVLVSCRIVGCTLQGQLKPGYGYPAAQGPCCSCNDPSKFFF